MASMSRRVRRRNRPTLTPGRRPGQPRAVDDPPTPAQLRFYREGQLKVRWDSMADLPG